MKEPYALDLWRPGHSHFPFSIRRPSPPPRVAIVERRSRMPTLTFNSRRSADRLSSNLRNPSSLQTLHLALHLLVPSQSLSAPPSRHRDSLAFPTYNLHISLLSYISPFSTSYFHISLPSYTFPRQSALTQQATTFCHYLFLFHYLPTSRRVSTHYTTCSSAGHHILPVSLRISLSSYISPRIYSLHRVSHL